MTCANQAIENALNSEYEDIAKCVSVNAFFGTPNGGSSSEALATTLRKMDHVTRKHGDLPIMEAFSTGSWRLLDTVHTFMVWAVQNSVDLSFFFQTQKTNWGRFYERYNEAVSSALPLLISDDAKET